MAWYISHEDEHVRLKSGRVIGRKDFVDAPPLSKAHLGFEIDRGVLVVRDLGSTNGTRLRGLPLTPNEAYRLEPGDALTVDELTLTVDWHRPTFTTLFGVAALVFASKLVMPGVAFGRAIGRLGLLSFGGTAVAAATLAVPMVHVIVPARFRRSAVLGALVLAAAFDFAAVNFLARRTRLVESIVQRRVAYYCLDRFDGKRCVDQVQLCPRCAGKIEKWKRDLIVRRLAAADRHEPPPAQ